MNKIEVSLKMKVDPEELVKYLKEIINVENTFVQLEKDCCVIDKLELIQTVAVIETLELRCLAFMDEIEMKEIYEDSKKNTQPVKENKIVPKCFESFEKENSSCKNCNWNSQCCLDSYLFPETIEKPKPKKVAKSPNNVKEEEVESVLEDKPICFGDYSGHNKNNPRRCCECFCEDLCSNKTASDKVMWSD